jgi:hypothetical protein
MSRCIIIYLPVVTCTKPEPAMLVWLWQQHALPLCGRLP